MVISQVKMVIQALNIGISSAYDVELWVIKKTWGMSANGDFSTKNRDNPQGLGVQKPNCQFAYPFNKTGTIYYPVGREFT